MAAKVTVRELVTKLTIGGNAGDKLAKFGLAMNGVKAGLGVMVGAVKSASAATLGLVDDVTALGDGIAKTSRQIGISAKSFQRLSFAADRSGAPIQNLKKGLQNIERNLRDASIAAGEGKGTGFSKALAEVGIRLKEFEGLNPEEKLGLIGEALSQVADKGRRVALSQKLVGEEAGPKLASLLAEGTRGIKALGDEAERYGLVMGDKAIAASEKFQDTMANTKAVLTGVKAAIGVALIPIVEKAVNKFKDWLLINRKFVVSKFEKAAKALTKAFGYLVENIDEIVEGFNSISDLSGDVIGFFMDLAEAVGGIERLIKLATAAWVTYKIAAIAATTGLALGPLALLAVGLLAVGAAFAEIETSADRARKARDRFNAGLKEKEPVDKKQAARDAEAIAKATREGKELSPALRARLASQNSRQTQISFDAARGFVKTNVANLAGTRARAGRRLAGKSGIGVGTRKPIKTGAGQLGLLKELELQVVGLRRDAADAREAGPAQSDEGFVAGLITPGSGGGGGGRSFKPLGTGGGDKDEAASLSEELAMAIKSGRLPESAALLDSTTPPILITQTNVNVQMEIDASMEFDGVAGQDPESFIDRVRETVIEEFGVQVREAMDEVSPQLAR